MSFVGSMLSNDKGSGFQAGQATDETNAAVNNLNDINGQLKAEAAGGGPAQAAAQAALTNATNQGIKQAAGTVASTKGINPALAGRLAGQQAAQSTQQGANQAATLQAGMQQQALGQLSSNATSQYGTAQSGLNNANNANAGIAAGNQAAQQQVLGGVINGIGSAVAMADGGEVPAPTAVSKFIGGYNKNKGSSSQQPISSGMASLGSGIGSMFKSSPASGPTDSFLSSGAAMGESMGASPMDVYMTQSNFADGGMTGMMGKVAPMIAAHPELLTALALNKGGNVKAMLSPGEKYLSPEQAKAVAQGKADPIKSGKTVPGKAPVPHKNTIKNDIVPANLQQGGVVIPIEVLESKNPQKEASKFVAAAMMHHKLNKKYPSRK